jgi:hypothetical protein
MPRRGSSRGLRAPSLRSVKRVFETGQVPDIRPRLDGRELVGIPVQFYRRRVFGMPDVCGLWIGGQPLYDVLALDAAGRHLGVIEPETAVAERLYDELRRVLIAEEIHA